LTCLSAGKSYTYRVPRKKEDDKEVNEAIVLFLQGPDNTPRTRILLDLVIQNIKSEFFTCFRGQSYTPVCDFCIVGEIIGIRFSIVTPHSIPETLKKLEEFIRSALKILSELTEKDFEAQKVALEMEDFSAFDKPEHPSEFPIFFSRRFEMGTYRTGGVQAFRKLYAQITLSELQAFYKALIDPLSRRQIIVTSGRDEAVVDPQTVVVKDTTVFKRTMPRYENYMEVGQRYIQSLLDFNQGATEEAAAERKRSLETILVEGGIIDEQDVENLVEGALKQHEGSIDPLLAPGIPKATPLVLTYCFYLEQAKVMKPLGLEVRSDEGNDAAPAPPCCAIA